MREMTEEQRAAVSQTGNIIVSASAGSGKTFVMIQRLCELVLSGADLRRILAVTFTKRAAAQMKERLRRALIEKLGETEAEERFRLKSQLAALPMAEISTIHSFCSRLVRTYFYLLDLDPAFTIISEDSAEGEKLFSRAMDEVFETCYAEQDESFLLLLEIYFHKKSDEKLKKILRGIYRSVRGLVDYRKILARAGETDDFEDACQILFRHELSRLNELEDKIRFLREKFPPQDRVQAVLFDLSSAIEKCKGSDLFSMSEAAKGGLTLSRMPASTKYEKEALKRLGTVKAIAEQVKEIYAELKEFSDPAEEKRRQENAREISRALKSVILKFDETLCRMKREESVLDYNDLEQFTYEILKNEEVLLSVRARYDYLFVDEFQDVNETQESILKLVGGQEVFFVGDAKQSIYAFRGSRSEFFLKREKEFPHALALTENFRSAPAILEAVNQVFSYSMTKSSVGFDYKEKPMRGGGRYGGHEGKVCFYRVPKAERQSRERGIYKISDTKSEIDAQAQLVCDLIQREVGSDWYDADEGLVKKVGYGDIAILVRKNSGDAEKIVRLLSERNIPVTSTANVNVCDFWEARLLIDVLSYLDNPEQDIPMAGAMLSQIGGFRESELQTVREAFPSEKNFRSACKRYALREDTVALKIRTFFRRTESYRGMMEGKNCAEIADLLLADGLEAEIFAKQDGETRRNRINRLISEMQGSVGDFLRRLRASDYKIMFSPSGGEDAVKILTIHSAKGLEFPVVILPGLDAPFHGADRGDVLFSEKFLLAPKSYDREKGLVYETLVRRATYLLAETEERKGELNLFYVAMTRAKYRLHMIFGERERGNCFFAKRFSDFIDFDACENYFVESASVPTEEIPRKALAFRADEALIRSIRAVYCRPYPFSGSESLPVKSSATQMMEEDPRETSNHSARAASVEEGLAYHAFLQHVDFNRDFGEELVRMRREEILPSEQLALLKEEQIRAIMQLPAIRALRGKTVLREQRFLALLPACELYPTPITDEILIQGAMDAFYQSQDGWVILDYKYSSRGREDLKNRYQTQISIYRKAAAKILKNDERMIKARIVNLMRLEEIEL